MPAERRAGAGSLAVTIEQAGRFSESAFMEDEIRVVARHFGPLEPVILAVHDHVKETTSNQGRCSCPAGQATADD